MIRFLLLSAVRVIHGDVIREFGGQSGTRDIGLLDSALNRAHNLYEYESANIYQLAAAYCSGIVQNHPFIDGNKRVGFLAAYVFLQMNGIEFSGTEEETVIVITGLAAGDIDDATLAAWFRANSSSTRRARASNNKKSKKKG